MAWRAVVDAKRPLYFRGAAEASVEPVREALPLERRL